MNLPITPCCGAIPDRQQAGAEASIRCARRRYSGPPTLPAGSGTPLASARHRCSVNLSGPPLEASAPIAGLPLHLPLSRQDLLVQVLTPSKTNIRQFPIARQARACPLHLLGTNTNEMDSLWKLRLHLHPFLREHAASNPSCRTPVEPLKVIADGFSMRLHNSAGSIPPPLPAFCEHPWTPKPISGTSRFFSLSLHPCFFSTRGYNSGWITQTRRHRSPVSRCLQRLPAAFETKSLGRWTHLRSAVAPRFSDYPGEGARCGDRRIRRP